MPESLELTKDLPTTVAAYLGYRSAADALCDPRGRLVRFTPWRRTVMHEIPGGPRVFCKFREGHERSARAEWAALRELDAIGLQVPRPLFRACRGRETVIGIQAVVGRPMDALLAGGARAAKSRELALAEMPDALRRLHDAGWIYRDMYWNHVFADLEEGAMAWIDVERAFRPRFRWRRWVVKDLAGLVASDPSTTTRTDRLRFLRDYLGGLRGDWRGLARAVATKAAAISSHVTRYPG